jgi:hypothetical protein
MTNPLLNPLQTIVSAINALVVPLSPDLATLPGIEVAKMWTMQVGEARRLLNDAHAEIGRVAAGLDRAAQTPSDRGPSSSPVSSDRNDLIFEIARDLFIASQGAARASLPQASFEQAKLFLDVAEADRRGTARR